MSLATINFWSDSYNSYGIPDTFHSYLVSVFVNDIIGSADKIIKIIPLTNDTPKPPYDRPFIIRNSTKENAITEALTILKEIPVLKDLNCSKSIIKGEKERLQFISNY